MRAIRLSDFSQSLMEAEVDGKGVNVIGDLQHHLYTEKSIVIPHLQPIPKFRLVIFCFDQVPRRPAPFSSCKEFYDGVWQRSNPPMHEHGTRNFLITRGPFTPES
jgi:hypothetical protein